MFALTGRNIGAIGVRVAWQHLSRSPDRTTDAILGPTFVVLLHVVSLDVDDGRLEPVAFASIIQQLVLS